jgi:transcription antitermination factor NusG
VNTLTVSSSSDFRWYAVYTNHRHEKRVAQHLGQRDIEHFLPLYVSRRQWRDGTTVSLDLPLFPCYLFVRVDRSHRKTVLDVPGIVTFVGCTAGQPTALPDSELETLRAELHRRRPEPHLPLMIGERARIRRGALAGFEGIILRVKGGLRMVVTLSLIMNSFSVEVDRDDLELLDPPKPIPLMDDSRNRAFFRPISPAVY